MYDSLKKLDVFRKAYQLSLEIHRRSLGFPQFEQKEIAGQLRRASKSICANLAEGKGKRSSNKETARFVSIAIGSNDEVRLWLMYAKDLGYLSSEENTHYQLGYEEVGRMLYGLRQSLYQTT